MRKFLALALIVLIFSGAFARAAFASTDPMSAKAQKLKARLDNFPLGAHLRVRLKDHRQVEGQLLARSEEGIDLAVPESVAVNYTEIRTVAGDPDGQSTPDRNQSLPAHHSHHLRNFLIAFGVGAVLFVSLAALDK